MQNDSSRARAPSATSTPPSSRGAASSRPRHSRPAAPFLALRHGVRDLVRHAHILDIAAAHEDLVDAVEAVAIARGADHLAQAEVHKGVARVQHAIVCLAGLELDEHRLAVRGLQERDWVHRDYKMKKKMFQVREKLINC